MSRKVKRILYDNSLSIVMLSLFAGSLIALSITGFNVYNQDQLSHHEKALSFIKYLTSSHFYEAIFENWESEFLQMAVFVVLTIFLRQKGSAESKKLKRKENVDTSPRFKLSGYHKFAAVKSLVYSNSLSIALILLFVFSFVMHAWSGASIYSQEQIVHGEGAVDVLGYLKSSQFWFESFQNWQSEFLSIAALIILAIFLRQRGSPESKPIGVPNKETGSE